MEAGRELDALVAEKVMGWQSLGDQWATGSRHVDRVMRKSAFRPSEDIAAAWEVVRHLDGQWNLDGQEGIGWTVSLAEASMREDRYENPFTATADTVPHAICLAALRAKGVEV